MREKLNSDPKAQLILVAVLIVSAVFLFMSKMGGGEEEEETASTEATVAIAGTEVSGTATGATPGEAVEGAIEGAIENSENASAVATPTTEPGAESLGSSIEPPPLPKAVTTAYKENKVVALLIVHNGGIDDDLTKEATDAIASDANVALFVVPASQIYRYAAITLGTEVSRVPALVVMRPKNLSHGTPQATVQYGLQTAHDVELAVSDAAYDGPGATYHPG